MQDDSRLDMALKGVSGSDGAAIADDFMDSVWMQAGRLEEMSARRRRLALMGVMIFVGLGAGFSTTHTPARAESTGNRLIDGTDLSPAALLHVEP